MNKPSLKDSLTRWTGFPKVGSTFEPRKTRREADKVGKLFGDVQPRAPETYDLWVLHRRVVESWRRDRSLAQLASRDLRRLPWVLFYPRLEKGRTQQQGPIDWLGSEPGIVQQYGRWLSNRHRTRSVLILLHEFLRVYPADLQTFDDLRELLRNSIERSASPAPASLRRWYHRCQGFGLLEAGGAGVFVQKLMSAAGTPEDVLRQAGLDAGLARCGFLETGIRECLPHAELLLRNDRLDDAQLDRMLTLLECDGRLRFDDRAMRLAVATALLRPFAERHPDPATRERLQPFFLRHFGDPRLRSGKHKWSGVPHEIRRVVIRWLVERSLEQFFLLVKETALDQHWRYREAFWRALLPLDPDIWFVLGPQAEDSLRKMNEKNNDTETTAILRGAQGDQSVLLMRMPGVTIAEWSHNGACRFWLDGNPGVPALHKHTYFRYELMRKANFLQRHDGSREGRWQDSIARWMRDNTGVEIERAEYLPDQLYDLRHTAKAGAPRKQAAAQHNRGASRTSRKVTNAVLLRRVRDAVIVSDTPRVNLRDFMEVGSPEWFAYVADHGLPGRRTRRQTVLDRLGSTLARLRSRQ